MSVSQYVHEERSSTGVDAFAPTTSLKLYACLRLCGPNVCSRGKTSDSGIDAHVTTISLNLCVHVCVYVCTCVCVCVFVHMCMCLVYVCAGGEISNYGIVAHVPAISLDLKFLRLCFSYA